VPDAASVVYVQGAGYTPSALAPVSRNPEEPVQIRQAQAAEKITTAYCDTCGNEVTEDMAFCSQCGAKVEIPEPVDEVPTPEPEHIYCASCGNELPGYASFCNECGTSVAGEAAAPVVAATPVPAKQSESSATISPVQRQTISQPGNLISKVPHKGGTTVNFYDDHLEAEGQRISYDSIAAVDWKQGEHWYFALVIWLSYFSWFIRFTLKNGQVIKISQFGFSLYSIGTTRRVKKRFSPMFNATNQIVAKAMAHNVLAQIRQGATVNIAGVNINSNGATFQKWNKKETYSINAQNFGSCDLSFPLVLVVDRQGNKLGSFGAANCILLPYVLTTLFGS
jgi:uncharacterized OB-fold protein